MICAPGCAAALASATGRAAFVVAAPTVLSCRGGLGLDPLDVVACGIGAPGCEGRSSSAIRRAAFQSVALVVAVFASGVAIVALEALTRVDAVDTPIEAVIAPTVLWFPDRLPILPESSAFPAVVLNSARPTSDAFLGECDASLACCLPD